MCRIFKNNLYYYIIMCDRNIHNYFVRIHESYCLYCNKFSNKSEYKNEKNKDMCYVCNDNDDIVIDNNGMYCKNCGRLIRYLNVDLPPLKNDSKKYKNQYISENIIY